jgi:hypothetical protein
MVADITLIKEKFTSFYENCVENHDAENKLFNFLFSEIYNDLTEKGIGNFSEWLEYYSKSNFDLIIELADGFYYKALRSEYDQITFEEKLMAFNAVALYSIEMECEPISGHFRGKIIGVFIEVIRHYNLVLKGYLSLSGEILISDPKKYMFYTMWSAGAINKKMPIILF